MSESRRDKKEDAEEEYWGRCIKHSARNATLTKQNLNKLIADARHSSLQKCSGFLCQFKTYVNDTDIVYEEQYPQIDIKCQVLEEMFSSGLSVKNVSVNYKTPYFYRKEEN